LRGGTAKSSNERERREALAEPRLFRSELRLGEALAIQPQALDFSYLWTGICPNDRTEDGIAIVRVNGPLEHHRTFWWDSYESILQRVEGAMTGQDLVAYDEYANGWKKDYEAPAAIPARAVVLCLDSPGGEAAGATYAHRKLRRLRKQYNVPLYAYANEMAASAAYELAAACDEIWLPDTGSVGSIGVIATLFDRTKANERAGLRVELLTSGEEKADNHADRPLTDEIRARMQGRVDELAQIFFRVVAKARGTSPAAVASLEAGMFIGQQAVDVGIADGVASWDAFLSTVARSLNESDLDTDQPAADVAA
jgi:signal peptide peptidase SppA